MIAVIYFFLFGRDRKTLLTVSLALFLAGILGNAYDRIFNDGRVRDFIDVLLQRLSLAGLQCRRQPALHRRFSAAAGKLYKIS